jgi:transposase
MRKVKEVLRLSFGLGLQQNEIARSCAIGQSTVHRYLQKAAAAGLTWPLAEDLDDRRLEELLFRKPAGRPSRNIRSLPDFGEVRRQLQTHKHLTLQLIWEEYRQTQSDGYGYSRFCELYDRWHRQQDVVMRQEHRAGEKMFVDWAGDTVPLYDAASGEVQRASLFVAVLGASTYTFACATLSQNLDNWVDSHVAAFEYCQGTPKLVVPDNPRTGVDRACRYEPDLNRTYHDLAMHYGVAVMPARPRKPRDKAKVENAVLLAERWIIAALRHHRFQTLADMNAAIGELVEKLNHRPFRKREGCRASLFAELDRPALQPLPAERYILAHWKTVRASIDYHVEVDQHYYSVPYQLAGQSLESRFTAATVEIFHGGKRVASHARSSGRYRHTTVSEHMPKSHQAHLEWTPSRLIRWAEGIGAATAEVVRRVLESKPHPEMGYRACLGILRLEKTYSRARLEAASQRAVQLQTCSYPSLKSILKRSLDQQLLLTSEVAPPGPQHENLRGPDYYDPPTTLVQ